MSWMSPFTVPTTATPTVSVIVPTMSGRNRAMEPFMVRADRSTYLVPDVMGKPAAIVPATLKARFGG